jgi:hypothetical protein
VPRRLTDAHPSNPEEHRSTDAPSQRIGGEVVLVPEIGGIDEVGTTWPVKKKAATVTLAPSSLTEAAAALEPDEEREA